ncbi:MAG: type I methionyl aminopeptidase [Planctomycetes bacterium]|nr:type I methionyl aminopeptidase [Planctomycetota bacterium]MBI3836026.1 type I methionyl aminopeptidase [Planctomycetota bacterium]
MILKSPREIELMRAAGRVVHAVLSRMKSMVAPGVTTSQLNAEAEDMILKAGGEALFKGVVNPQARFPFPAALCTSVNEELVHGIPNNRPLKEGDIVSVDCGVRLGGYCGDSAVTIAVGSVSRETKRLMDTTSAALGLAISLIRPGRMWSEVATAMQKSVESSGLSVVREYVGHGIGREMHEEPKVPNYWSDSQKRIDFKLLPRMVLAVEPMVNLGGPAVEFADKDRWVIVTKDRKPAAHFEHTVTVTDSGADVLTDGR